MRHTVPAQKPHRCSANSIIISSKAFRQRAVVKMREGSHATTTLNASRFPRLAATTLSSSIRVARNAH